MDISLPFITQSARRKKSNKDKPSKRRIIKIHSEHTPLEIMNMDMPDLMYIYKHGSVGEREIAENVLRARKKWEVASSLSDDVVPSDAPNSGSPNAYVVGQRGD
jgi:hypothetical protein